MAPSGEEETDDGLPPPAYQPSVEEAVSDTPEEFEIEEELDRYLAPRAPAPGTPSPDALRRLQTAVSKAPQQPAQRRHAPAEPAQAAAEERPRFGINSLINRMTGHAAADTQRPARQQPTVQTARAPQAAPRAQDEDEDQIEIPAFLRRQAN